MILLTGASGNTGRRVLSALVARGAPVRTFVSRQSSALRVKAEGASEVVTGDFQDAAAIDRAMAGVSAVYHLCPPMSHDEVGIGRRMIDSATRMGVGHFVFHSLVHAQVDALQHHRDKRVVEGLLCESRLAYTILQPTMYMQNLAMEWETVVREGVYRQPYSSEVRMSLVDLDDVAEAAAVALTEPGYAGGCFELCSGDNLTRAEMAQALSEVLQRPVAAEQGNTGEWLERARSLGTRSEFQIERVLAMFAHYDRHGLSGGNSKVLESMLGRKPNDYRAFLRGFLAQRS